MSRYAYTPPPLSAQYKTLTSCMRRHIRIVFCIEQIMGEGYFRLFLLIRLNGLDSVMIQNYRSQRPHYIRIGSSAARLLGLQFRIPPRAWIFVSCECRVLSSRCLFVGLTAHPAESCRVCCVLSVIIKPRK
jgi:hypothetical protein